MAGLKKTGGLLWFVIFSMLTVQTAWSDVRERKVAVLPFVMRGQQDVERTQKALDDVFVRLCAREEGMKLIDPREVAKAAGAAVATEAQAHSVGSKLGADYAVFGSFNQIGNAISIDATLVDVSGKKPPVTLLAEEKGAENLALAVGKIVQQMSIHVLSKAMLADVKIKGNDRIEAEAIKAVVKSKKGELLKPEVVSEDIRAIFKMGSFEKVDAEISDSPAGKVLTFIVQENPTVQEVKFVGNKKVKEKDLLAAIVTKPYSILQRNLVSEDVQKILKLYQQKGYYNAEASSKIEFPKDPRKAVVSFNIQEKNKVYIKSIDFSGNKSFSARKLRGVMQTKVKSLLSYITDRGVLQKDILDTDIDRITAYYHDEGYMDAKAGSPAIELKEDGFHITIPIVEGERYTVTDVSLTGDLIEGYEQKILKNLHLKPKLYFSREEVRHDMELVTKTYMNEGYARVEVDPRVQRNPENHTTTIELHVVKNDKVRIGQILVTGNTKTKDNVIRRELKIYEGDTFNSKKIEDSITHLKKLDFFEDVEITPVDTPVKEVMNLNVKVKEKQTGSISVGGGYSSLDGLFVTGKIEQRNLYGNGDQISLQAYLGQLASRYMISYTKPWLFGTPFSAGIDLYDWVRAYQDFTKTSYGFKLRAGYPIGQWSAVSAYYNWERGKIDQLDYFASKDPIFIRGQTEGFQVKSAIGLAFERNTTDHPFLPTKGTYVGSSWEYACKDFGGDYNLFKQEYHSGVYYPLFWKFIGHLRGEVGFEEPGGVFSSPLYERFFLGGIDSLRGWQFSEVGPKTVYYKLVYGGDKYVVVNAELLFPLVEKYGVRGVTFFDTGNAFDGTPVYDINQYREDVGAGIRWNSPFGPLRIEVGYILDKREGEKPYRFQFSGGAYF